MTEREAAEVERSADSPLLALLVRTDFAIPVRLRDRITAGGWCHKGPRSTLDEPRSRQEQSSRGRWLTECTVRSKKADHLSGSPIPTYVYPRRSDDPPKEGVSALSQNGYGRVAASCNWLAPTSTNIFLMQSRTRNTRSHVLTLIHTCQADN